MQKLQKLLYTTAEAKGVIGCGTTRLYELLASGKLRARRLGHSTMIEAGSLHELVDSLPPVVTPTMAKAERDKWAGRRRPRKAQEGEPGAAG